MWSGQWPGARGLGPGLGLKYEIVLRAGPGLDIIVAGRAGHGPHNSICGPGQGLHNCRGPGPSNHICGSGLGLDFRPMQGPNAYPLQRALLSSGPVRCLQSGNEQHNVLRHSC